MTVTAISRRPHSHIRPLDLKRDLNAVADLLEAAFGDQMDENGIEMLRQMRHFARLGAIFGQWVGIPLGYGSLIMAFVWEEEGRIIGHAMVMRMDYAGTRWQISNVAVDKAYRGQGIGRALMETVLEYLHQRHARWALLQVRVDNPPAVHLYRSLGFETVCGEIHWERHTPLQAAPPAVPPLPMIPVRTGDMSAIRDLVRRSITEPGRWWWLNLRMTREPESTGLWLRRLTGLRRSERWGYKEGNRWVAYVELTADRWANKGYFSMYIDTAYWGRWEPSLVAWVLQRGARAGISDLYAMTELDYIAMTEALEEAGFYARHRLLNMRLDLTR